MESLLLSVLVCLVIFAVVFWAISLLPIPEPYGRIARVVVGVVFLLWLLRLLLPMARF